METVECIFSDEHYSFSKPVL